MGLQRGGEKETDGNIRDADYADTREAVKYASTFRFRVILNLYATIADLKEALSNARPTIILWTSHGNTSGIYDADSILVPYSIFEKASPSVYQFITASCNGGTALTKYTVPKHIKTWGWSELVYHPGMLATFLNDSSQWGPFINYPYGFKGMLQCKEEASLYYPYNGPTKLPGSGFAEYTSCIQSIMSSVDGFACVAIQDGFGVVSIPRNQLFASSTFPTLPQCHRRTLTTHLGRTCLRMQADQLFHIVDSATQTSGQKSYEDRNACISDLFELTPESLQANTPA